MFKYSLNLSRTILGVFIILMILSIFSLNFFLTIESAIAFYFVYKFSWRRNEPPIIFFAFAFQLIQVIAIVIISNFKNEPIEYFTEFPYHIYDAFQYSLLSIVLMSFAFNLVTHKLPIKTTITHIENEIDTYDSDRIIIWYFILALSLPFLQGLTFSLGAFQQIGYKFLELKWVLFFIFYFAAAHRSKRILFFSLIVLIEILLGFSGFFSNYKEVTLAILLCYFTYKYSLETKQYIVLILAGAILVLISVMWQYSKNDYRQFLAGETSQQVVNVSREEALSKFLELSKELDKEKLGMGAEQLFRRVSYLNYFSAAIDYVPSRKPHQNGKLLWEATTRSFMPRFLFPDKEIVDDSKRTIEFTGVTVAGAESATSISMGYISELYVDFGSYFLLFVMFGVGVAIGLIYRLLYSIAYSPLWFYAYLVPLMFSLYSYEIALSKFVPALVLYIIIIVLFNKVFVKKVDNYFRNV